MSKKHIAVLMGGLSSERPVSLSTGNACADVLETLDYKVSRVDVGADIAEKLAHLAPDVAFNALHGPYGEDGTIQGVLEYLSIPYTHSGVLSSALAMDKEKAKFIAERAGIPVAQSIVMNRHDIGNTHPMALPYVIKPVCEGSSFGIVIVSAEQSAPPQIIRSNQWQYGDMVMVERYIHGREFTCAVIGDKATGVIEIIPNGHNFYDYDAKYVKGGSKHELPAKISLNIYQKIQKLSVKAHQALGCRGVTRSDFRFDEHDSQSGELIWLEVNTQPGMTPTSLLPELAEHDGQSFAQLLTWIVEDASCMR